MIDNKEQGVDVSSDDVEDFFRGLPPGEGSKRRSRVRINECNEDLIPIPQSDFLFVEPHPYQAVGAPYRGASPFYLRKRVVEALLRAQSVLQSYLPGHRMFIWDGYRPRAVQRFMVERELAQRALDAGLDPERLSHAERENLLIKVYELFAPPSDDPLRPPPHSTGGAVDVTICDPAGNMLDMGGPIDGPTPICISNYYDHPERRHQSPAAENRLLLLSVMQQAGFRRLPYEWWHFSLGDQWWAILETLAKGLPEEQACAHYGPIEPEQLGS